MTTATIERRKEAICPPWCTGHDDRYQPWEELTDGTGQIRQHSGASVTAGGAHAYLNQTEDEDHTLRAPTIDVFVDHDTAALDRDEAEQFAIDLLAAVQRLRDWNAFQLGRDYERGLGRA